MKCPDCASIKYVKDGIVKGRQRYKCKRCSKRFTIGDKRMGIPLHLKRIAIILYLEGYPLTRIAEYLEVSHTAVTKWLKYYHLEKLMRDNRDIKNKHSIRYTTKDGLRDSDPDKKFNRWMQIRWNKLESVVFLVKKNKPWENKIKDQSRNISELELFRDNLRRAIRLSRRSTKEDAKELQEVLSHLAAVQDDMLRIAMTIGSE